MKALVEEDICVGSGICEDTCPRVFHVVNGVSKVQVDEVPKEEDNVRDAVDGCPVSVIVTEEYCFNLQLLINLP